MGLLTVIRKQHSLICH